MPPDQFTYGGINYRFSKFNASGCDNMLVQGQEIRVPRSKYFSYHMLAASESGMASASIEARYSDGSTTSGPLLVPAWWSWPYPAGADLSFGHYLTENTTNFNRSNIFQTVNWVDSSKEIVSLSLPNSSTGASTEPGGVSVNTNLHIFAISFLAVPESQSNTPRLAVQYARSTQKWVDGSDKVQIIEVLVNNVGSSFITPSNSVRIQVQSPGLDTIMEGTIKRLGPGDQATIEIGVQKKKEVFVSSGPATVIISGHDVVSAPYSFNATYGIRPFEATYESIYSHESPNWYNNAKFGIFIHWGVYSVPGWGNSGSKENYAECLFLQELFDTAKKYQPHLHRSVYYSLPEWFHPDYEKYGFGQWPGGNATNPFTNETLPYTGYVPLADFIDDKILPEMNILADMGTEIMWCDIGGPNKTLEFASAWFNSAAEHNRSVVMNSRCGLPGDFDTPEYAQYKGVQRRKWESSAGMDPYSYGFNRATPQASYMNASAIVTTLVDIVSKNGNFLLDIGPMANGTILDIEQQHLREAGKWIKSHAEAIYDTSYWFVAPEEGEHIRFTTSPDAFYIHCLTRPNATLTLSSPIPWMEGDNMSVVGGHQHGVEIPSMKTEDGSVVLSVSREIAMADQYVWVFKISY
ncbi:uncharacterized protein N7511_008572 [Penicillium nucicola]|uniref:uncharacterized protein n=1 Tax=Penicillium nucicola TaxID=1850975 RepID=UPI0025450833|nr:uncharacterized protein N7511_008572 [Penicillium nucicola]KAJ5746876.1 hypothetical protein N7511_008572 [Penicillium nucicola]